MADLGTSAALKELYNIAIQSLDELKLNSTATEYALFCEEMEQFTVDTAMSFSNNRRRMEMEQAAQYYNHYQVPEYTFQQPQPTFKKPLPLRPISGNPNVSIRSFGQRVNQQKNRSSAFEKSQVEIGIPPGVKLPGPDWSSSEEISEDEGNQMKKKHNNVSKKPPNVKKNKRKSSNKNSTLETEEKNKKYSKESTSKTVEKNKRKPSLAEDESVVDDSKASKGSKKYSKETSTTVEKNKRKPSLAEDESSVDDFKPSKDSKKKKRQSLNEDKFEGIEADFVLKNWTLSLKNKHLFINGDQYDRALNLLKNDFVSPPIMSAKKVQGKFVIKTKNTSYLLIDSKMKDDSNLPEEVKNFCKNEFPHKWRQCITLWAQIQTLEETENDRIPEPQMKEKKIPEMKKQKNAAKRNKNESKAPAQKKNEKTTEVQKNEPENNGKSIFQKMMADDSLDAGNCMTPSALLNSIKKSNVSAAIHTPPSNFMRDLQNTSVFELSVAKSSDLKKKHISKVVERMSKNVVKKGNVPVQNIEPRIMCEKVDFDKILPHVQETSTFCSDSELSSITD